jgi:hypothetical protein
MSDLKLPWELSRLRNKPVCNIFTGKKIKILCLEKFFIFVTGTGICLACEHFKFNEDLFFHSDQAQRAKGLFLIIDLDYMI